MDTQCSLHNNIMNIIIHCHAFIACVLSQAINAIYLIIKMYEREIYFVSSFIHSTIIKSIHANEIEMP